MSRIIKWIANSAILAILSLIVVLPVMGASVITSISLHVSANIFTSLKKGEEQLIINSTHPDYVITDYEFSNEGDYWRYNDRPQLKIELKAKEGYHFSNITKEDISISGSATTLDSLSKSGNGTIILLLSFRELSQVSGKPINLKWTTEGKVTWDAIPNTSSYDIRLYRDGVLVMDLHNTRDPWYNLSAKLTKAGTYIYHVRSHHYTDFANMSDFAISPSFVIDNTLSNAYRNKLIGWRQDSHGWWYQTSDEGYLKNGWILLDEYYYYFDENGYLLVDTITPDGYKVDENGIWIREN